MTLAATPYEPSPAYWERVVKTRLRAGEASRRRRPCGDAALPARAAISRAHRAQRRLREAYFVAIVTPATKQLKKMLADGAQ